MLYTLTTNMHMLAMFLVHPYCPGGDESKSTVSATTGAMLTNLLTHFDKAAGQMHSWLGTSQSSILSMYVDMHHRGQYPPHPLTEPDCPGTCRRRSHAQGRDCRGAQRPCPIRPHHALALRRSMMVDVASIADCCRTEGQTVTTGYVVYGVWLGAKA